MHSLIDKTTENELSNFGPLATPINDGKGIRDLETHCNIFPTWHRNKTDPEEIDTEFRRLISLAQHNATTNRKIALFIHYSGHGALINGHTVGFTISGSQIPIESCARKLAMYKNTFVILVMDCCCVILESRGGEDEVMPERFPGHHPCICPRKVNNVCERFNKDVNSDRRISERNDNKFESHTSQLRF